MNGSERVHDLYRTTDGVTFVLVATPKLAVAPMQITDCWELVYFPALARPHRSPQQSRRRCSIEQRLAMPRPAHGHLGSRTSATISSNVSSSFSEPCGSKLHDPSHVS